MRQFDCLLCSETYVLGGSMDGLLRHVCMPKHLKKWLEHTDGAAPEAQLRASLARKWVPFKVEEGHESYVAKRTATKEAGNAKARKVMRSQMRSTLMAAISSPGSAVGASNPTGRSTSASGGSSTDGASTSTSPQGFTLPPITPENAAQVGAMIAAMPITHRVIR